MFKRLTFILLIAALVSSSFGTKYAGEALSFGFGGRALALGGGFMAVASDPSVVYWNPAGLINLEGTQALLMYGSYFEGLLTSNFLAVSKEGLIGEDVTLGLGLYLLSSSGIPETELPYGGDPSDTNRPFVEQELAYSDIVLYLSGARPLFGGSFGLTLKLLREDLSVENAMGIGLDLGYLRYGTPLSFGLVLRDAFTTPKIWSSGKKESITPTLNLGLACQFSDLFLCTADLTLFFEGRETSAPFGSGFLSLEPHFGVEFAFSDYFSLRTGLDRGNPTFGAGLTYRFLSLDYAFLGHVDLGSSHRASISGRF
jgi:hypothetical protein